MARMSLAKAMGVAGAVSAATLARAVSVEVPASADTTLYEDPNGALANGAGAGLFAGTTSQASNAIRRGLVRFDIAGSVPAGATITGATLRLSQSAANTTAQTITLHRVLGLWGEGSSNATAGGGGSGAPSQAGDATWIHRSFSTEFWATPGGDFVLPPMAATSVAGPGFYSWSGPSMISDAQAMLDGTLSNFGWILLGAEGVSGSSKRFSTREEPIESLRPALVIEYVPAPAAAAWFFPAAFLAVRARRRPD